MGKLKKILEEYKSNNESKLSLVDQGIQDLHDVEDLFSLKKTIILILAHNKLSILPAQIADLEHLEQLNLSNNSIKELPIAISSLRNLKILKLCFNRLTSLPKGFGAFPYLEILDLTSNQLNSTLPNNFFELKSLRALYLSDNKLEEFPLELCQLVNLQILSIRDNQLTEIPNDIKNLVNLQELYIQSNQIKLLPPSIVKLDLFGEKSIFNLDNNPWIKEISVAYSIGLSVLLGELKSDRYIKKYQEELEVSIQDKLSPKSEKINKLNKK